MKFGYLKNFSYLCIVNEKQMDNLLLHYYKVRRNNLIFNKMVNIDNFLATNSNKEFSIDIHFKTMGQSDTEVMYITITAVELDTEQDYTVILNGLPTPKNIKKICDNDVEAAEEIIKDLKRLAVGEARKYWNFDKDEWEMNLDLVLKRYKESIGIVETDD